MTWRSKPFAPTGTHPHIIPFYALGRSQAGRPIIVMRRIRGRSWREILEDPTPQPLETRLETLLKVIAGLTIPTQILFELLTYWFGLVIGGILIHRRLGQVSVAYLAASVAILIWPEHALVWLTASSGTVLGVMALVWRTGH